MVPASLDLRKFVAPEFVRHPPGPGGFKKDIPGPERMAKRDPCMATNPRNATVEDIGRMYEQAL
ncbi:MAG: hypothetical protein LUQ35_10590 [Methanoregula sp.]|jgi:hypothetical protein|nr:hypothetical protein [Methanoregula sp.]